MMNKKIYLGWAHSFDEKHKNFGDELSPYIITKLTDKEILYIPVLIGYFQLIKMIAKRILLMKFEESVALTKILIGYKYLLSTGSILQFYKFGGANVWGSGLIDSSANAGNNNKYFAVRGPKTRNILIKKYNSIPEVYGDPALILKKIYDKKVDVKFDIGFIPHIIHYEKFIKQNKFSQAIKVINLKTDNVELIIDEIRSCKLILSSSLHGLIVAHTYNIPALWINIDEEKLMGDNLKFRDYFSSVDIKYYDSILFDENLENLLFSINNDYFDRLSPDSLLVDELVRKLLANTPFEKTVEFS